MSVFRPQKASDCEFNFDDKITYSLPLHEDTIKKLSDIASEQIKTLKAIDQTEEGAFDKAYNLSLDALDEIFGEGAGADIMSIFENPGLTDIADVINYIVSEYSTQYEKRMGAYKAAGKIPPNAKPRGRR